MMLILRRLLWATLLVWLNSSIAMGAEQTSAHAAIAACKSTQNDVNRLQCYDQLFGTEEAKAPASLLDYTWDLKSEHIPLYVFSSYQPNYVLPARYVDDPNAIPASPTHPLTPMRKVDPMEMSYQLSFKNKLLRDVPMTGGGTLWFAYTQKSFWQLYNTSQSSPFRESDYAPELILSLPARNSWSLETTLPLDLKWKMLNLAILHESNGQSGGLSRSWNRLYAEFGFDNEHLAVLLRPWMRIPENGKTDDNPDITRFMGYGDARVIYKYEEQYLSVLGRYSVTGNKGALQADYVFPIAGSLKGYLQGFSGYGNSLIDYNRYQNVLGLGVLITPW